MQERSDMIGHTYPLIKYGVPFIKSTVLSDSCGSQGQLKWPNLEMQSPLRVKIFLHQVWKPTVCAISLKLLIIFCLSVFLLDTFGVVSEMILD